MFLLISVPSWFPGSAPLEEFLADVHKRHEQLLQVRFALRGRYGDITTEEELERLIDLGSATRVMLYRNPGWAEFALFPATPWILLPEVEELAVSLRQFEAETRRKMHLSVAEWRRRYEGHLERVLGSRADLWRRMLHFPDLEPGDQDDLQQEVLREIRNQRRASLQ